MFNKIFRRDKKVVLPTIIISGIYWLLLLFINYAKHTVVLCASKIMDPLFMENCQSWPRWFASPCDYCVTGSEFFQGLLNYILLIVLPPILLYLFFSSLFNMIDKIKNKNK